MKMKKDTIVFRRIIWLLLWVLSIVSISNFGGVVSYGFFWGMTLLPVVSFVYLLLVSFCFRIYQKMESVDAVAGMRTEYYFTLKNESILPFAGVRVKMYSDFSYVENMKEDTEYELLKGDEYTFRTNMICKYRGEYYVGIKEVIITDFLRLFRLKYKPGNTIQVLVKPPVTKLNTIESIVSVLGILEKDNVPTNTQKDVLVRDYVSGDSLKHISWKLSAKENKLMVRKEIGEEKQGVALIGDMRKYYKDKEDFIPLEHKMLEIMSSLGMCLTENNVTYKAYYNQGQEVAYRVAGVGDFREYYNALCKVVFKDTYDFVPYYKLLVEKGCFYNCKVVFCVLHELNHEVIGLAEKTVAMECVVVLYVVSDRNYEEYMKFASDKLKIVILPVEANIKEIM